MKGLKKATCPHCGYEMPLWYDPEKANCKGVFIKCKGRVCGKTFEVIIKNKSDK